MSRGYWNLMAAFGIGMFISKAMASPFTGITLFIAWPVALLLYLNWHPRSLEDKVDDAIDKWHGDGDTGIELHDFLGWTKEEYFKYVEDGTIPRPPKG